jgi:hypothetical protein
MLRRDVRLALQLFFLAAFARRLRLRAPLAARAAVAAALPLLLRPFYVLVIHL